MGVVYYLEPEHTSQKSFYNKATVEIVDKEMFDGVYLHSVLRSYGVVVAWTERNGIDEPYSLLVNGNEMWYSTTTLKHIKEYAMQEGFPLMTKQELRNLTVF